MSKGGIIIFLKRGILWVYNDVKGCSIWKDEFVIYMGYFIGDHIDWPMWEKNDRYYLLYDTLLGSLIYIMHMGI